MGGVIASACATDDCGQPPSQFPNELTVRSWGDAGSCMSMNGKDHLYWSLELYRNAPADLRLPDVLTFQSPLAQGQFRCVLHLAEPSPIALVCDLVGGAGTVVQHDAFHGTLTLAGEATALASEAVKAGSTVRGRFVLNGTSAPNAGGSVEDVVDCALAVSATWAPMPGAVCI